MHKTYLLVINGKPEGPFSLEELKLAGIEANDFVRSAEMPDYKEAHEVEELRDFFGFNRQALIPQYFGSFDQRLLAAALDWFMVGGACVLIIFAISLFIDDKEAKLTVAFGLLAMVPLIKFVYQVMMESSAKQATLGKMILAIKVCDMQGEKISTARSLGRNLAKLLSVFTLFIGYLVIFFNKRQQGLHDMVAGTLVMKDRLF